MDSQKSILLIARPIPRAFFEEFQFQTPNLILNLPTNVELGDIEFKFNGTEYDQYYDFLSEDADFKYRLMMAKLNLNIHSELITDPVLVKRFLNGVKKLAGVSQTAKMRFKVLEEEILRYRIERFDKLLQEVSIPDVIVFFESKINSISQDTINESKKIVDHMFDDDFDWN